ncbi:MAG: alginate lyase family protein [Proteobacteria bacterium]|nr:alginate lyase family protein [Pseudomonadota bacterium]
MHWQTLARRARRRAAALATRARYRTGLRTLNPGPAALADGYRPLLAAADVPGTMRLYARRFPEAAAAEVAEARRLQSHEFLVLGHSMRFGAQIAWSRDPRSGRDWPDGFSPQIPYRGPQRLGDIKLPWELAKQQYLVTLAKAAWLAEDPSLARSAVAQMLSWIEANPPHRGIHWISALETGTRVLSWMTAMPFLDAELDREGRERVAHSVAEHLLFIERNLSDGEFTNTHLAGEAAILAIGALFVDCRHSTRWRSTALEYLERELQRQVWPDGAHREQSVAYHRFFLDQYYLAQRYLSVHGLSLSARARARIESMTQFLMDMVLPDGTVPRFGDNDEARGIWFHAACSADYRALLALGAVEFGRSDFAYVAAGPCEELLWLYGSDGLDAYEAITPAVPDHLSVHYPDAGYTLMRSDWRDTASVLALDSGPLGHGPAGHGHADALSIQLQFDGRPLLVDPGTYSYNIDYEARGWFRGTAAHNTVTVDGLDQSVARDRMSWSTAARTVLSRWETNPWFDLADAHHDGYHRLADPVKHRRVVLWLKPGTWVIVDQITARAEHEIALTFHLAPDCRISGDGRPSCTLTPGASGPPLVMSCLDDSGRPLALDLPMVADGDWYSPRYGERIAGRAIRLRQVLRGPGTFFTLLQRADDPPVEMRTAGAGFTLRLHDPHAGTDTLIVYGQPTPSAAPEEHATGALRFDGALLYRRTGPGRDERLLAMDVSELRIPGLIEVASPTGALRLEIDTREGTARIRGGESAEPLLLREGLRRVDSPGASGAPQPR